MAASDVEVPIRPPDNPIICSPFRKPDQHWVYDRSNGLPTLMPGRRPASYWYKTGKTGSAQLSMFAEEERDDLPLINALRDDVERWRESGYESATPITKRLLSHWRERPQGSDRRRLFFCQLEAVETVIYLTEMLGSGKKPRWTPKVGLKDYGQLTRGVRPDFLPPTAGEKFPTLVDDPGAEGRPLLRYGCKMATGSGKTVVMAMLIAWALCNRGHSPSDDRFPSAALIVCPNLTIKDRLQVLRPDHEQSYYVAFDLVPSALMPELKKGRVLVTNWHRFAPESEHSEGGKSYAVVNKGPESPEAFAQRVLGDLAGRGSIMVLNDEAHHAYRPAPPQADERLSREQREDREEATIWVSGLDRINEACGVRLCVDVSATPFYLQGSGYPEGSPFPWLVSDFGLVDAIESGIVKIPRLPVSDVTGRPEPKYYALWKYITEGLSSGQKLPGGKPKPETVWLKGEDALQTLASQYQERFQLFAEAGAGQERTPPVMIIVCDNTDIAKLFYQNISGEEPAPEGGSAEEDEDDEDAPKKKGKKSKPNVSYGTGKVFPALFSNTERQPLRTLRIDSKLLAEAESETPNATKKEAAEELREIVATVGRIGKPGEQVRCVVSVQMLSEGWDANNVTHILGLRAFGSQLLCEQVVGRGLRRMDYTVNEHDMLEPEYVDIYGVPFSLIPFKGRSTHASAQEDRPKNHVYALPERKHMEIRFPVVEGYAFALRQNMIKADVAKLEPLKIEQTETPTAVFVKPQVSFHTGTPMAGGPFAPEEQDREAYYESTHLQTIKFELARRIVSQLTEGVGAQKLNLRYQSRHQLFPQVYRIVDAYVGNKVNFHGCDPRELGLEIYATRVVERLMTAIEPNDAEGEPPLVPILNRYKPIGSTGDVNFKTTRPCYGTTRSHINQVVLDTGTWEQAASFRLEQSPHVAFYARNDHMEFVIPYEYLRQSLSYTPDFLVRLTNGATLVLEIKGQEDEQDRAKHQAARRWRDAVNNWGELGRWAFHVCHDPQMLGHELAALAAQG